MRDNKPLEQEAVYCVCSKLGKINLKYINPSYDENGGDLMIINELNYDTFKSLIVQVKGRDITINNSNVRIHESYIKDNFVCFLYIKIKDDLSEHLFCFFSNDISKWDKREGNYCLNIPKNAIQTNFFEEFEFAKRVSALNSILQSQEEKHRANLIELDLLLLDNCIKLWQKSGALPDSKLTNWFLKNLHPCDLPVCQNVFLTCLAFVHSNILMTSVDYMFQYIKEYDISFEGNVHDIVTLDTFRNDWLITYRNSYVDVLELQYNGVTHNGFQLTIGDREEQVKCILIDNSDLKLNYVLSNS